MKILQNKGIQSSNHILKHNLSQYKAVLINSFISKAIKPKVRSVVAISGSLITISCIVWHRNRAKCDLIADPNEESIGENPDFESVAKTIRSENFDFAKLWLFVRPDSLYLLIAITVRENNSYYFLLKLSVNAMQSALIVALLNIEIPLSLGSVMNVLSRFANEENSSFWSNQFFSEIRYPAFKVFQLYFLQVFKLILNVSIILRKITFEEFVHIFIHLFAINRWRENRFPYKKSIVFIDHSFRHFIL